MKTLKTLVLILTCPIMLMAQVEVNEDRVDSHQAYEQRMETFSKNGQSHGIYFGIGGGQSQIGRHSIGTFHTRLAYVSNQAFEIGLEGQSHQGIITRSGGHSLVAGGFGGFHFKAIFRGNKKVHLGFPVFAGFGVMGVGETTSDNWWDGVDADIDEVAPAFVLDPGINIELNLNRFIGVEFGAKYRFASTFDESDFLLSQIDGWIFSGTLKFGFFDFGGRKRKTQEVDYYNDY